LDKPTLREKKKEVVCLKEGGGGSFSLFIGGVKREKVRAWERFEDIAKMKEGILGKRKEG